MKNYIIFLSCVLSFLCCGKETLTVEVKQIYFVDHKIHLKSNDKPFSGILIEKFKNGSISGEMSIKDGVQFGKWKTFDRNGQEIQRGEVINDDEISKYLGEPTCFLDISFEGNLKTVSLSIYDIKISEENCLKELLFLKENFLLKYKPNYIDIRIFNKGSKLCSKEFGGVSNVMLRNKQLG